MSHIFILWTVLLLALQKFWRISHEPPVKTSRQALRSCLFPVVYLLQISLLFLSHYTILLNSYSSLRKYDRKSPTSPHRC